MKWRLIAAGVALGALAWWLCPRCRAAREQEATRIVTVAGLRG